MQSPEVSKKLGGVGQGSKSSKTRGAGSQRDGKGGQSEVAGVKAGRAWSVCSPEIS